MNSEPNQDIQLAAYAAGLEEMIHQLDTDTPLSRAVDSVLETYGVTRLELFEILDEIHDEILDRITRDALEQAWRIEAVGETNSEGRFRVLLLNVNLPHADGDPPADVESKLLEGVSSSPEFTGGTDE